MRELELCAGVGAVGGVGLCAGLCAGSRLWWGCVGVEGVQGCMGGGRTVGGGRVVRRGGCARGAELSVVHHHNTVCGAQRCAECFSAGSLAIV